MQSNIPQRPNHWSGLCQAPILFLPLSPPLTWANSKLANTFAQFNLVETQWKAPFISLFHFILHWFKYDMFRCRYKFNAFNACDLRTQMAFNEFLRNHICCNCFQKPLKFLYQLSRFGANCIFFCVFLLGYLPNDKLS